MELNVGKSKYIIHDQDILNIFVLTYTNSEIIQVSIAYNPNGISKSISSQHLDGWINISYKNIDIHGKLSHNAKPNILFSVEEEPHNKYKINTITIALDFFEYTI